MCSEVSFLPGAQPTMSKNSLRMMFEELHYCYFYRYRYDICTVQEWRLVCSEPSAAIHLSLCLCLMTINPQISLQYTGAQGTEACRRTRH